MSETAAAKPAAKAIAETAPPTVREQKMREAMAKKFTPSAMQPIGQDFEILAVAVPADWSFDEVLKPVAWVSSAPRVAKDPQNTQRDKIGSLIHAHHPDFFAVLIINAIVLNDMKQPAGLTVTCIGPAFNPKTGKACPINVKTGLPWTDPAKAE